MGRGVEQLQKVAYFCPSTFLLNAVNLRNSFIIKVGPVGFEPTTKGL